ncbi:MAG TPA: ABC transporter substrate-binding protein [Thermoleophilaceae bacterium]|jgi:branched-chain amino acid transport system substrate-binding protein
MRKTSPTYPARATVAVAGAGARATLAAAAAAAVLLAGCGGSDEPSRPPGDTLTVYSSLPRRGLSSRTAEAVAAGERLALADAHGRAAGRRVRLVDLDSSSRGEEAPWDPAAIEANARRAVDDETAVAYLGELELGGSAVSVPVTNAGGLLQVSPLDGLTSLTRVVPGGSGEGPERYYPDNVRTFVRIAPIDAIQAATLAQWALDGGARSLAVVRDERPSGLELSDQVADAARRLGLRVTDVEEARSGRSSYDDVARDVDGRPDAVVYTGLGGPSGDLVLAALRRALPRSRLYASTAVAADPPDGRAAPVDLLRRAGPASAYGPPARRLMRRLRDRDGKELPTEALLGYEAMRLVLDALATAGPRAGERAAVARAAVRPGARISPLGRYAIARTGDATAAAFAGYRSDAAGVRFVGMRGAGTLTPRDLRPLPDEE